MKKRLAAFIPQHISNRKVLNVLSFLRRIGKVSAKKSIENHIHNLGILTSQTASLFVPGEYVENQAEWKNVRFGSKYTMSYSGCEILAVYNALISLGEKPDGSTLADLISAFEKKGAVLKGMFGTSPKELENYFRDAGYQVTCTESRKSADWEILSKNSDTVIATFYNDGRNIFRQVHTVNISKDEDGFYIHNGYVAIKDREGKRTYIKKGPFGSLSFAIQNLSRGNAEMIYLIGISCK